MTGEIISAIGALLFVIGLMLLMLWVVRKFGLIPGQFNKPKGTSSRITIVETRMLDPRNRLVLVKWDGHEYLLATGQAGVSKIAGDGADDTLDTNFKAILEAGDVE